MQNRIPGAWSQTGELASQLWTGCVQTISWERKILPLLSRSYFDFCYNSQTCFLMNTGIHFYTLCANEHLDLKETNNLPETAYRTVPSSCSNMILSLRIPLWYGNASEVVQLFPHTKGIAKSEHLSVGWCINHPPPIPLLSILPSNMVGRVLCLPILWSGLMERYHVTPLYCRVPLPYVCLLSCFYSGYIFLWHSFLLSWLPVIFFFLSVLFLELERKRILAWKVMIAAWQCVQGTWVTFLCVMFWVGSFMRCVWTNGVGEEIPQKPRCMPELKKWVGHWTPPTHTKLCIENRKTGHQW